MTPLNHDADVVTVRLVRSDTTSYLVTIPNANAWVSRRSWLTPQDVD